MKYYLPVIAALFCTVSSAQIPNSPIIDSKVFNWKFYLYNNPDLISAGINSESAAAQHWFNSGIYEGRQAHPAFHTRQYLDKYADLKNAFGYNYVQAAQHYVNYGVGEGRIGYFESGAMNQSNYLDQYGRITISNKTSGQWNDPVYVSMSNTFAGAIDSIYWRGKEFINSNDHGRQVQYAWQYASELQNVNNPAAWNYNWSIYRGECDNPTEAGVASDYVGYATKSSINFFSFNSNTASTISTPAYWATPDHGIQLDCAAPYPQGLSNDTLRKDVTIISNYPTNIIKIVANIYPENTARKNVPSRYEVPALYLSPEFNTFFSHNGSYLSNLAYQTLCNYPLGQAQVQFGQGCERPKGDGPIIASDSNGHAIGALVVENNPSQYKALTYAFYTYNNSPTPQAGVNPTTKISPVIYTHTGTAPITVTTYIAVGDSVNAVLNSLMQAQNLRP